jgi:hypothetical protein
MSRFSPCGVGRYVVWEFIAGLFEQLLVVGGGVVASGGAPAEQAKEKQWQHLCVLFNKARVPSRSAGLGHSGFE